MGPEILACAVQLRQPACHRWGRGMQAHGRTSRLQAATERERVSVASPPQARRVLGLDGRSRSILVPITWLLCIASRPAGY